MEVYLPNRSCDRVPLGPGVLEYLPVVAALTRAVPEEVDLPDNYFFKKPSMIAI